MKTITKYVANDGSEWNDPDKARKRDFLLDRIKEATSGLLKPRPKDPGCHFANGGGYVQQEPAKVREYKLAVLRIAKDEFGETWPVDKWIAQVDDVHPLGGVARILSENSRPLDRAWWRICCIDPDGREWGQPYYANADGRGTGDMVEFVDPS